VFLVLFAVVAALLLFSLIVGAAKFPSTCTTDQRVTVFGPRWDRYSEKVGLHARVAYGSLLVRYSKPYYFPPPFNLLQWLIVRLPWTVWTLLGLKMPPPHLEVIERILWRFSVGPFVGIFAGIWSWDFWT
jgi:hypothetical protein